MKNPFRDCPPEPVLPDPPQSVTPCCGAYLPTFYSFRGSVYHKAWCPLRKPLYLKPFAPKPRCPKCRSRCLSSFYHTADLAPHDGFQPVTHLDRTCDSCHFSWFEHPADEA